MKSISIPGADSEGISTADAAVVLEHLHTAVCHGHGVVRHGVAGDLAVIGTGDGSEHVAGVDEVGTGRVSPSV